MFSNAIIQPTRHNILCILRKKKSWDENVRNFAVTLRLEFLPNNSRVYKTMCTNFEIE